MDIRRAAAGPSRLNVRHVYAADADDALQTHALHYPGEHIVSMQRGWAELTLEEAG